MKKWARSKDDIEETAVLIENVPMAGENSGPRKTPFILNQVSEPKVQEAYYL